MQTTNTPNPLNQYCLANLHKILDLAMHTAETASAEGNHKIVLQAVREVTRIITLMTKLDANSNQDKAAKIQAAPVPVKTSAPAARHSDLEALTNGLVQDMLNIFPGLADTPTTENRQPQTENRFLEVGKKREITGTKPAHR
jgi:hypothetical protein